VRLSEIQRDREVRQQTLQSELSTAMTKIDNALTLAAKRVEEAKAEAEAIAAGTASAEAEEAVRTARERAAAERDKVLALIRAAEQAEVDDTRVRSEVGTLLAMAEAEAKATLERATAARDKLLAEAEGRAAVIAAENAQSTELMEMKLDEARIRALPEVLERVMRPAEKIESIRINHITGMGGSAGQGGEGGTERSTVNQVVDGVLAMALQLPAVQKLGEEVGMNIGDGVRGLTSPLSPRGKAKSGEGPAQA